MSYAVIFFELKNALSNAPKSYYMVNLVPGVNPQPLNASRYSDDNNHQSYFEKLWAKTGDKWNNYNGDVMPSFMVKKEVFDFYRFGKRDIELRTVESQWKNSKAGDIATIHCGRRTFIKRITKIHRGSLARIFLDINYKRIFPEASTLFEAVKTTKELYPYADEFMAFELKDIV